MQSFTLTITDKERSDLMFALGCYTGDLIHCQRTVPLHVIDLANKIAQLQPVPVVPVVPPPPTAEPPADGYNFAPPAAAAAATPAREHWAPKFSASSPGVESLPFEPLKVERKDTGGKPRLLVLYNSAGKNIQASCWHEELFGHIANRTRQRTTFYVTRKDRYINIVGLAA